MAPLAFVAISAIVLPLTFLTWTVVATDRTSRKAVEANLGLIKAGPRHSTWTVPEQLAALSRKVTPVGYAAKLDRRLAEAGRPRAWPLDRVLIAKPVLGLTTFALTVWMYLSNSAAWVLLVGLALIALGYFLPDILLYNTAIKRREDMQRAMPNMLDQMLISVEAGVGFEAAMGRAAENGSGPLADEFIRTLQDIQIGRPRREAFLALAERAPFADLRSFIRAVVQADQYGIAIANVLRAQAKEMRTKRRQRAEEHAMKIPVKILFPLMLTILPALFIVVMGPAFLNIVKMFAH
ncbi:type II secretion system F family protein [Sinomonas sp. R1AF57]|uniref:type II secretion system F family protein n=1 Tax=Sinomonas sp. R1AF57 TaxID=2020377 RepID=UPI000B5FE654|nr:type II secretion system F family protein [Sinomonas sp. R1AF57]ASN52641.1 secretion system protein [Sinomonas sp. R1AF57]